MRPPKARALLRVLSVLDIYSSKFVGERGRLSAQLIASLSSVDAGYIRRFLPKWVQRGFLVRFPITGQRYAHNGKARQLYQIGDAGNVMLRGLRSRYHAPMVEDQHDNWVALGCPDITGLRAHRARWEAAMAARAVQYEYREVKMADGSVEHIPVRRAAHAQMAETRRSPGGDRLKRLMDEYQDLISHGKTTAAEKKLEVLRRAAAKRGLRVEVGGQR